MSEIREPVFSWGICVLRNKGDFGFLFLTFQFGNVTVSDGSQQHKPKCSPLIKMLKYSPEIAVELEFLL